MEVQDTRRLLVRMEEEENADPVPLIQPQRRPVGFKSGERDEADSLTGSAPATSASHIASLITERTLILESKTFSSREKQRLLEANRKTITIVKGGRVTKTENVVYGILIFGAVLIVVLSLLNTFANLPTEITLSFVGTVLGGVIATIAQKLGRI
jgi:hypothetical protein